MTEGVLRLPSDCGLLPITQTAMRFLKIGYHEYQGVVLDDSEKASLVRDLGQGGAVILRNHGALVVGRTPGECFNLDPPPGVVLPLADRRDVVQHQATAGAAGRAGGDLEQLPARHAAALWPDGMAGPCCASWSGWTRACAPDPGTQKRKGALVLALQQQRRRGRGGLGHALSRPPLRAARAGAARAAARPRGARPRPATRRRGARGRQRTAAASAHSRR